MTECGVTVKRRSRFPRYPGPDGAAEEFFARSTRISSVEDLLDIKKNDEPADHE
jgi:hypothetical protein